MDKKIRVIVTGATGMVGEGVMHECLLHPAVSEVLIIVRKSTGVTHPKLKEIVHADFYNIEPIKEKLAGYDACFFCLGISSVGMKEDDYYKITYNLTMHVGEILVQQNPFMTFCYISGAGTDSTEKGRLMWARVKGKTENDLQQLGFAHVYNFRPAIISPTKGLKNTLGFYKWLGWMLPILRTVAPNTITSLKNLGIAMINTALKGYPKTILEVKDINLRARENGVL
jgi:uncharacterized protein YbjT (DUF2867 family)